MSDYRCMASAHTIPANLLIEDDRILLKDLRVLGVTQVLPRPSFEGIGLTLRYYELAAKERGSLDVDFAQIVKLLCPYATGAGRCALNRLPELAEIL